MKFTNRVYQTSLMALILCFFVGSLVAQDLQEPEFAGNGFIVTEKMDIAKLPRISPSVKQGEKKKAKGLIRNPLTASPDEYYSIDVSSFSKRVDGKSKFTIIINAGKNDADPSNFISIVRFNRQDNSTELLSDVLVQQVLTDANGFPRGIWLPERKILFEASKFGSKSYKLVFDGISPGEYGINFGSDTYFICFGID